MREKLTDSGELGSPLQDVLDVSDRLHHVLVQLSVELLRFRRFSRITKHDFTNLPPRVLANRRAYGPLVRGAGGMAEK